MPAGGQPYPFDRRLDREAVEPPRRGFAHFAGRPVLSLVGGKPILYQKGQETLTGEAAIKMAHSLGAQVPDQYIDQYGLPRKPRLDASGRPVAQTGQNAAGVAQNKQATLDRGLALESLRGPLDARRAAQGLVPRANQYFDEALGRSHAQSLADVHRANWEARRSSGYRTAGDLQRQRLIERVQVKRQQDARRLGEKNQLRQLLTARPVGQPQLGANPLGSSGSGQDIGQQSVFRGDGLDPYRRDFIPDQGGFYQRY